MTTNIFLPLGSRSYDITIGNNAIDQLPNFLSSKNYSKIIVITDKNVAKYHLEKMQQVLSKVQISHETLILEPGEQSKSFNQLEDSCNKILDMTIDRKSLIIAFGGGVIGDLSGFIASILLRGIDFIQVPTTLLSAVDSSVGGKTAINSENGKNLIGSFYQPKLVLCDINFLKTLPPRQLKAGYGEVAKYGFIADEKFLQFLENNYQKIFDLDDETLEIIIKKSCEIKAKIVANDEKEAGQRALLNFGHSFGHIFETETNYSQELFHGEAVALGMVMAAKMSQNFGLISQNSFLRVKNHLQNCGFIIDPTQIRQKWNQENLTKHLYKDKKNENGHLTFILLEEIGNAIVKKEVELAQFDKILAEFLKI